MCSRIVTVLRHRRTPWLYNHRRFSSLLTPEENIRNIGILAHIDAGKTTVTERILYYSGRINTLGEVHHGNTVTDYMSQERERGITICSSAVSLLWNDHKINILDTPGHIDFTMEVEQSLGAVDGSVIILDASAGVEAQTITVWNQLEQYELPKIIFTNKMDRSDADFIGCLEDLKTKFTTTTFVPLQYPYKINNNFNSIIDLISMKLYKWDEKTQGRNYEISDLPTELRDMMLSNRNSLIDDISTFDDGLANFIIQSDSMDNISPNILMKGIRNACLSCNVVPVLLGSAYKNVGIQSLMNGILNYLPNAKERNTIYNCFGDNFVGKVFKVIHDQRRGPLSLVRVYRGKLKKGTKIVSARGISEVVMGLFEPLADEYHEISEVSAGNVAIISGLKSTITSDLLVPNFSILRSAQNTLAKKLKLTDTENVTEQFNNLLNIIPKIPDPVYFCSIEPETLSKQQLLENALKQLQREDPSLKVKTDEITMQTVLGGMGELHLDVIRSRLKTDYKLNVELGPLQIAYKETIANEARDSLQLEKEIAAEKQFVSIEISLTKSNTELFRLDSSPEATQVLSLVRPRFIQSVKKGVIGALDRGPLVGGQIVDIQVVLHKLVIGRHTAESFVMAAAAQCVLKVMQKARCRLLEPIMSIQVVTQIETDTVSAILADLNRRRGTVMNVYQKGNSNKVIDAIAPLAELSNYVSVLRSIASGNISVAIQPYTYLPMDHHEEQQAILKIQGIN